MSFFLHYKSHHIEVACRHTHAHTEIAHFLYFICISLCIMFLISQYHLTAHPIVAIKVTETWHSENLVSILA